MRPAERVADRQVGRQRAHRRQVPARLVGRRGTDDRRPRHDGARVSRLRALGIGDLGARVRLPRRAVQPRHPPRARIDREPRSRRRAGALARRPRLSRDALRPSPGFTARPEHSAHQRRRPRRIARCRRGCRHRRCALDRCTRTRCATDPRRGPGRAEARPPMGGGACRANGPSSCTATAPTRRLPRALRGCCSTTDSCARARSPAGSRSGSGLVIRSTATPRRRGRPGTTASRTGFGSKYGP